MTEQLTALLEEIKNACITALNDALAGVYVHGSIAFDCFTWEKSDVDFLVVVNRPISLHEKIALMNLLLDLEEHAPPKGIEISVVRLDAMQAFSHPAPYELHYSGAYHDSCRRDVRAHCERLHGVDGDLAAHCTVMRAVGFALCGMPVEEVFAPVSKTDYIDSIIGDIASAHVDIIANPVYMILNLCRVMAYLTDEQVLSKRQGGTWGLANLPELYHPLIQCALDAYADRIDPSALSAYPLVDFADDMLRRIRVFTTADNG